MSDTKGEQAQNLRDVLEFDPDSEKTRPQGGNVGTPILTRLSKGTNVEEDLLKYVFKGSFTPGKLIHTDPDRLFDISVYYDNILRIYKKVDVGEVRSPSPHINAAMSLTLKDAAKGQELDRDLTISRDSDNPREGGKIFGQTLIFSAEGLEVMGGTGDRTFKAEYDTSGAFRKVHAGAGTYAYLNEMFTRLDSIDVFYDPTSYQLGEYVWGNDSTTPWQWKPDEDKQQIRLWRGDAEDPIDDLVLPFNVDISGLRADLFPDHLLRNPKDSNPELDRSWKDADLFKKAGVSFSSFKNDSIDSMPEPKWMKDIKKP